MVFAKPSGLRLFISENRSIQIIHLLRHSLVKEPVLKECTGHAGSPLRLESYRTIALVGKGVHLLLNDVGRITDTAHKELGVLDNRGSEFVNPINTAELANFIFNILPFIAFAWKNIFCALRRLNLHFILRINKRLFFYYFNTEELFRQIRCLRCIIAEQDIHAVRSDAFCSNLPAFLLDIRAACVIIIGTL